MTDNNAIDSLIAELNGSTDADADDQVDKNQADDSQADESNDKNQNPDNGVQNGEEGSAEGSDDSEDEGAGDQAAQSQSQANAAFAKMRVQNREYAQTLANIAQLVGMDPNDPQQLIGAIQQKVLATQAQKQGLPPEVLGRLQQLESRDRERNAYSGFQRVKDEFKLTEETLGAFADELVNAGLNPFQEDVDVYTQYVTRHMADILKSTRDQAILEEQRRAADAASHSSSPNQANGGSKQETPDKISTQKDLNNFLNTLSGK